MADAAEVFAGITRRPGTRYTALVPNLAGLERALAARRHRGRHLRRRVGDVQPQEHQSERSTSRWPPTSRSATARTRAGLRVRGYLSTAFGCPYEGDVPAERVADVAARLARAWACSKWRSATRSASRIRARCRGCSTPCWRASPVEQVALHFHDTRGTALANVLAALPFGIATFDASAGGLGGCPYAPGAAGNLATDDLIYMLDGLGIETGVSLDGGERGVGVHRHEARSPLPSRYAQAASGELRGRTRSYALKRSTRVRGPHSAGSSRLLRTASC